MKGLVYVLAFAIGFASGPVSISQATSQADRLSPTALVAADSTTEPQADSGNGSPGTLVGDAEVAKVVIEAPTKGRVGELIRFDLTQSEADSIKWLLLPESVDFEAYEDGRRAVFSARSPGDYMFIIAVAKGGSVDVVTHTVKIEGPPERPEGQSLVDWIPYWLYPMQLDSNQALLLAASFEEVASRITAISTPKGIIEATAEANRAALGDNLVTWKPLLAKIKATLEHRAKNGTLATPDQHKETWREIAKGLRRYAQ